MLISRSGSLLRTKSPEPFSPHSTAFHFAALEISSIWRGLTSLTVTVVDPATFPHPSGSHAPAGRSTSHFCTRLQLPVAPAHHYHVDRFHFFFLYSISTYHNISAATAIGCTLPCCHIACWAGLPTFSFFSGMILSVSVLSNCFIFRRLNFCLPKPADFLANFTFYSGVNIDTQSSFPPPSSTSKAVPFPDLLLFPVFPCPRQSSG